MIYLASFLGGGIIGIFGAINQWPKWFTYGLAILWGLALTLVSHAGEVGNLKQATLHIENGSGFLLKTAKATYAVTNYHVCLHGSWHSVLTGSLESGEVIRGKITKRSPNPDLCVAKVESRSVAPLELAPALKPLERVYTRGYPRGVLSQSEGKYLGPVEWTYDFGIDEIGVCPSEADKLYDGSGVLSGCRLHYADAVTTLYSRPGSSGSPVVNSSGQVVGVMSSWDSGRDAGGMVRLQDLQEFFKGL